MLEKRTSGGGVCVGGVAAYGRSQPADSTQHTAHRSGVDVDEVVDRSGGIASGGIACRRAVERSSSRRTKPVFKVCLCRLAESEEENGE